MQLDGAIPAMQKFMLAMTADKTIPLPRDVDVMTGGPPCQVRCPVPFSSQKSLMQQVLPFVLCALASVASSRCISCTHVLTPCPAPVCRT